jgi:hypothetical protein
LNKFHFFNFNWLCRWAACALEACKAGAESDSRFDGVVLVSDSLNNTSSHAEHLLQQSKVL